MNSLWTGTSGESATTSPITAASPPPCGTLSKAWRPMSPDLNPEAFAVVIPVYNHAGRVREVALAAAELGMPVIVVDDGSTDGSYEQVRDLPGIEVLRHPANQGKGAAPRDRIHPGGPVCPLGRHCRCRRPARPGRNPGDDPEHAARRARHRGGGTPRAWAASTCTGPAGLDGSSPISGYGPRAGPG